MKILIVEDDVVSSAFLEKLLAPYGKCDIAVDGQEAIEAFLISLNKNRPYDLICLDIMMPNLDGQQTLKRIREIEKQNGLPMTREVKVIMTTALDDPRSVIEAYNECGATSYLTKPISKKKLINELISLGLIST